MRLSWFIANRLGKRPSAVEPSAKRLSRPLSGVSNYIAMASVAVSVLVIIIAVAVSSGFRKEIKAKAIGFCGDVTISPPGLSVASENQSAASYAMEALPYLSKIERLDFVSNVQAISYRSGLIKTEDQIQGTILKGVDSTYNWSFFRESLTEGELPNVDSAQVIVSKRLADMLGLTSGGNLDFYCIGSSVQVRRFRISGIYSAQLEDFDKLYVITGRGNVNRLNGWDARQLSSYEILFKDHNEAEMARRKAQITDLIYENMQEEDQALALIGIDDSMFRLFDWLHLLDLNVLIILVLMIAVAGFNMISCILIILFENISAIGVFKAMGMKNSGIAGIFLAKTSKIVLYGLLAGNVVAMAFCIIQKRWQIFTLNPDNYFLKAVPVNIAWETIVAIDLLCFAAIMLILLIPTHFISKISPAKTIRVK